MILLGSVLLFRHRMSCTQPVYLNDISTSQTEQHLDWFMISLYWRLTSVCYQDWFALNRLITAIKAQSMAPYWCCYFHTVNFCCDIDCKNPSVWVCSRWIWHLHSGRRCRKSGLFCFSCSLIWQFVLVLAQADVPFPLILSLTCEHSSPPHASLHTFTLSFSLFFFPPLSDFMIKVVEVSDSSQQKTLRGHEAPVLSVTFDPKDDFLVGKPGLWWQEFNTEVVFCLFALIMICLLFALMINKLFSE